MGEGGGGGWKEVLHGLGLRECCGWGGVGGGAPQLQSKHSVPGTTITEQPHVHTHFIPVNV